MQQEEGLVVHDEESHEMLLGRSTSLDIHYPQSRESSGGESLEEDRNDLARGSKP